jgi:hypothetical protein
MFIQGGAPRIIQEGEQTLPEQMLREMTLSLHLIIMMKGWELNKFFRA